MRYIIEAEVIRGQQLGREMGFPTANMDIAERTDIENGVYRSLVEVDGRDYLAMSNVGVRPSVDGRTRLLEPIFSAIAATSTDADCASVCRKRSATNANSHPSTT